MSTPMLRGALVLAIALVGSGCAHTILIAPETDRLPALATALQPDVSVAYTIDAADRARTVTTPGGGGDKVAYLPYRDLEAPLYRVLSNTFGHVYSLPSPMDAAFLHEKNVRFVFAPHFETTSSSDSLLTWPPTEFTVTIDISATDAASNPIWKARVSGSGHATFSEFKSDFGLAAKRASEAAFHQLDAELAKFPRD